MDTWNIIEWFKTTESPWKIVILYLAIQSINVVTSTIKSVILVKGSRKTAIITNTLHYVINAFVVALIGQVVTNIPLVLIITAITNIVGVWVGLSIIDKLRKEQLWRISATVKSIYFKLLINELHDNGVEFITYQTSWKERTPLDVFSHTKEESKLIHEIFNKYNVKYTINSNSKVL